MRLLALLKTQTVASHAALEDSMDVFGRVKTLQDYQGLLRKFFTLYEPLERELAATRAWAESTWDFREHVKTSWLREDLQALGITDLEMASWPRCEALPGLGSRGQVVGCLYVLEGSTLGGQVLSREFNSRLDLTPGNGGRFFSGYGSATGQQWRAFGEWADRENELAGGSLVPGASRGADETFATFARWLT